MIILYSTNCPKCKVLEKKMQQKNCQFEIVDDVEKVVAFGREHGLKTAPILDVDGTVKDFTAAIAWVKEL